MIECSRVFEVRVFRVVQIILDHFNACIDSDNNMTDAPTHKRTRISDDIPSKKTATTVVVEAAAAAAAVETSTKESVEESAESVHAKMKALLTNYNRTNTIFHPNVGGRVFTVTADKLANYAESRLAMFYMPKFADAKHLETDILFLDRPEDGCCEVITVPIELEDGEFYWDLDPDDFEAILRYIRTDTLVFDPTKTSLRALRRANSYWNVAHLNDDLKTYESDKCLPEAATSRVELDWTCVEHSSNFSQSTEVAAVPGGTLIKMQAQSVDEEGVERIALTSQFLPNVSPSQFVNC